MDIKARFAQMKNNSKPKSDRLAALWLRGDVLSSGKTEDITVIAKPSEDGSSFTIFQGDAPNLEAKQCNKVIGTLRAPATQDKVSVKVDAELFENFIFRGVLKIKGVPRQATMFVSSEEEIAARCEKSGAEPGKFPPAYILYTPDATAIDADNPTPPKSSKSKKK
jgi:hypothetical protein